MNLTYPIAVEPINPAPPVIQPVFAKEQPIPVVVEKTSYLQCLVSIILFKSPSLPFRSYNQDSYRIPILCSN